MPQNTQEVIQRNETTSHPPSCPWLQVLTKILTISSSCSAILYHSTNCKFEMHRTRKLDDNKCNRLSMMNSMLIRRWTVLRKNSVRYSTMFVALHVKPLMHHISFFGVNAIEVAVCTLANTKNRKSYRCVHSPVGHGGTSKHCSTSPS